MKVVINKCYGGFSVSLAGVRWMAERGHPEAKKEADAYDEELRTFEHYKAHGVLPDLEDDTDTGRRFRTGMFDIAIKYNKLPDFYSGRDFERHDPLLIACVEALGAGHRTGASGEHASLSIVEIPDGVEYEIGEYDGMEHVAEKHRTWA